MWSYTTSPFMVARAPTTGPSQGPGGGFSMLYASIMPHSIDARAEREVADHR